jgi:hypothetical protein
MAVQAWPFLIARGRQRGYSVLLAPHFLLAEGDYGFLEEATGPVPAAEPVRVAVAVSQRGRRSYLTWSEHRVTSADLGGAEPRDEHSRPLLLLYGFLCTDAPTGAPAMADLDHARRTAMDTYRRFLADENGFTTEPSAPFDTYSPTVPSASPPPSRPAPSPAAVPAAPSPVPRTLRRLVIAAAVVAGTAAAAVVVTIVTSSGEDPPASCDSPTPTAAEPTTTSSCGPTTLTTTPAER